MPTFLYTWPSERLLATGPSPSNFVAVQTGTEQAGYPATNLDDNLPSNPAKLNELSGAWTRHFNTPQQVDFCAVINHNLNISFSGLAYLVLEGNSTNEWSAPPLRVVLTVAAAAQPWVHVDGSPQNLFCDLTTAVPVPINRTWAWWRLVVAFANSAPIAIGEWCMYSKVRNFGIRNISKGSTRTTHRPSITHTTERLARLSYDLGVTVREVSVSMEATDQVAFDVQQWFRIARGTVRPFCIVPHALQDEAWFVNFAEPDFSWQRANHNYNPLSLRFHEVSRGLNL